MMMDSFVTKHVAPGAKVYTDDHGGYEGLPNHETVRHSVREYVNGQAHTNGIESFWAMLKRGYRGHGIRLLWPAFQVCLDQADSSHPCRDHLHPFGQRREPFRYPI